MQLLRARASLSRSVGTHVSTPSALCRARANGSGCCAVGSERPFEIIPLGSAEPHRPSLDGCLLDVLQGKVDRGRRGVYSSGRTGWDWDRVSAAWRAVGRRNSQGGEVRESLYPERQQARTVPGGHLSVASLGADELWWKMGTGGGGGAGQVGRGHGRTRGGFSRRALTREIQTRGGRALKGI